MHGVHFRGYQVYQRRNGLKETRLDPSHRTHATVVQLTASHCDTIRRPHGARTQYSLPLVDVAPSVVPAVPPYSTQIAVYVRDPAVATDSQSRTN